MTGDTPSKRVLLGRIGRPHGVRGDVVIESYTAEPAAITGYGALTDASGTRSFCLRPVRATEKGVVVHLAGVDDRDAAEALRGVDLYASRAALPEPEVDAFYHEDLIGLRAIDASGVAIGQVVGVHNFGAGDILEVRFESTGRNEMILFRASFVPVVDVSGGHVVLAEAVIEASPAPRKRPTDLRERSRPKRKWPVVSAVSSELAGRSEVEQRGAVRPKPSKG